VGAIPHVPALALALVVPVLVQVVAAKAKILWDFLVELKRMTSFHQAFIVMTW
jgi:hypothetical protein